MNKLLQMEMDEIADINVDTRFKIEDKEQLNWALRKLSALKQEQTEVDHLAEREIERITDWRKKETEKVINSIFYFEGAILEYAMNQRKADPKFNTVSTPFGKVEFCKQPIEYSYNDQELVTYLESAGYDDLVKVEKKPVKTEILKRFVINGNSLIDVDTGAVVPGVMVTEREDKLEIKVSE